MGQDVAMQNERSRKPFVTRAHAQLAIFAVLPWRNGDGVAPNAGFAVFVEHLKGVDMDVKGMWPGAGILQHPLFHVALLSNIECSSVGSSNWLPLRSDEP